MKQQVDIKKQQIQNSNFDLSSKVENFILEIVPVIKRFPKVHKYTFGQKIEQGGIDLAEMVFYIQFVPSCRLKKTVEANMKVQLVTLLIRLTQRLNCITLKQYEKFSSDLTEIGKVLSRLRQVYEKNR